MGILRRLFDVLVGLVGGYILALFYSIDKSEFPDDEDYLRATIGDYYNFELLLAITLLMILIGFIVLSKQTTILNKINKLEEHNNQMIR